MAPVAIAASGSTVAVSSSSILGQKLPVRSSRTSFCPRCPPRPGVISAKYGEKSVYFDLDDIANTTGAWDLYGSDAPSPYNGLQSKFFQTFAGLFSRRGLLLRFLLLAGAGTVAYVGSSVPADYLPIKKTPEFPSKKGPGKKL